MNYIIYYFFITSTSTIKKMTDSSNKANYEYTDQDIQKIINVLQAEISTLKSRFKNKGSSETVEFKLLK